MSAPGVYGPGQGRQRLAFVAYGKPAAQGSKVRTKYAMRDSNDETLTPWRNTVSHAAHLARQEAQLQCIDYSVYVRTSFYFRRPKSHYRTGRNAHLLRDDAPALPGRVGDVDKLQRAVYDAITDSGVWTDDALITDGTFKKRYVGPDQAMQEPGVIVEISAAVAA